MLGASLHDREIKTSENTLNNVSEDSLRLILSYLVNEQNNYNGPKGVNKRFAFFSIPRSFTDPMQQLRLSGRVNDVAALTAYRSMLERELASIRCWQHRPEGWSMRVWLGIVDGILIIGTGITMYILERLRRDACLDRSAPLCHRYASLEIASGISLAVVDLSISAALLIDYFERRRLIPSRSRQLGELKPNANFSSQLAMETKRLHENKLLPSARLNVAQTKRFLADQEAIALKDARRMLIFKSHSSQTQPQVNEHKEEVRTLISIEPAHDETTPLLFSRRPKRTSLCSKIMSRFGCR